MSEWSWTALLFSRVREVYQYRHMLWGMILSDLRTRYRGSVLGFLWTFVNPLLTLLVYTLVFSTVMRIDVPHYPVFLFIGLLAWNMFALSIQNASSVIIRQSAMVKKIYFPREILPLAVVGGSLFNFIFSLVILFPFVMISGFEPTVLWLYFPLILLVQTILTAGFALLFSSLTVFFRDLEHILTIFVMVWFYVTPVVYQLSMVPHRYGQLFKLNPVTDVIYSFQDVLYYGTNLHWRLFGYGAGFSLLILVLGWTVFHRLSKRFAEEV